MKKLNLIPLALTSLLVPSMASAALIAHYDFADGDLLDDEQGVYTLANANNTSGTVTANPDGSAAFSGNDGWLSATGPGGATDFTVSFWMRTDDWTQGNFQGLFSNEISSAAAFSWQIDVSGGTMRLVSATSGFAALTTDASGFAVDTWHHIVLRKSTVSGIITTELFATEIGAAGPNSLGTNDDNPGGLQNFRLGTNRNDDSLFRMDMANVKVYNDANATIASLFAEGPQTIPEPSSTALLGLGTLGLMLRRRR